MEIGAVWGQGRRIAGVLHGLAASELVAQNGTPALMSRVALVELNGIDNYLQQLARWNHHNQMNMFNLNIKLLNLT